MGLQTHLKSGNRLDVVCKHIQAGLSQVPDGIHVASEVRRQALNQNLRPAVQLLLTSRFHTQYDMLGANQSGVPTIDIAKWQQSIC